MDISWFGLALATTSRFLSIYAIHIDATPMEVAWITSLPSIVYLFTSMLGGWWRSHYPNSVKALFWPALGFRMSFFMLAFAPFLPLEWQPYWLIFAVTLPAIPQGIAGVVFLVMMREAVEPAHVAKLVGRRSIALNIAIAIGAVLSGFWLENVPFPVNYQVMFLVAFLATLVSFYHCNRVQTFVPMPLPQSQSLSKVWRSPRLWNVAFTITIPYVAFFALVPIVPFFLVDVRGATEGFIAFYGLMELGGGAFASALVGRLLDRFGDRRLASYGMIGTAIAAVMIAVAPSNGITLLASAMMGGSWALASVALFSVMSNAAPDDQAMDYSTVYQQTIGLASFIGPILGSALAQGGVNLVTLLLLGAAIRMVSSWAVISPPNFEALRERRLRRA